MHVTNINTLNTFPLTQKHADIRLELNETETVQYNK